MEGLKPVAGAPAASPYEAPELYDRLFDTLDFDVPYWLEVGKNAGGPVLELACGTGRILLRLLEAGIDADGVDRYAPMLARLAVKASARGRAPMLLEADMTDFTMSRRYARVICPFNGFAHAETPEMQLRTLRCCREHLERGGAMVLHMSYPGLAYWTSPDGEPVLETEVALEDGGKLQLFDTRKKDAVNQRQHSLMEARQVDAAGAVVRSEVMTTTQRWVYRNELELLFRLAGFSRWDVYGGFAGEALERDDQQMVAWAWRD